MSDTHPRYIVARRALPDYEADYEVVDTTPDNSGTGVVMCAVASENVACLLAEALNFQWDLAASPKKDGHA